MRRVRVVVNMVPQHVFVHNASDIITVQEICELSYRSFVVVVFFFNTMHIFNRKGNYCSCLKATGQGNEADGCKEKSLLVNF